MCIVYMVSVFLIHAMWEACITRNDRQIISASHYLMHTALVVSISILFTCCFATLFLLYASVSPACEMRITCT